MTTGMRKKRGSSYSISFLSPLPTPLASGGGLVALTQRIQFHPFCCHHYLSISFCCDAMSLQPQYRSPDLFWAVTEEQWRARIVAAATWRTWAAITSWTCGTHKKWLVLKHVFIIYYRQTHPQGQLKRVERHFLRRFSKQKRASRDRIVTFSMPDPAWIEKVVPAFRRRVEKQLQEMF